MKVLKIAKGKSQSNLGRRCKSFEWHCVVCEHYRYLDLFGKFPTDNEVDAWAEPYRQEEIAKETGEFKRLVDKSTRFGRRSA